MNIKLKNHIKDGIAVVTINEPKTYNSLSFKNLSDLIKVLKKLDKDKSTKVIKYLAEKSGKAFPIIGVGGIHSAQDALEKIEAGADLVQVYTGFIYEGPQLIKSINKALIKKDVS